MIERDKELKNRINEKIGEIEKYLGEFNQIEIPEFEEYSRDFKLKASCERYFEKIIEALISLSLLVIRLNKLDKPENEDHIFIILSRNKVITENLAKRLKEAKDMRNIVIHNYIKVEDSIVYQTITEEIVRDAQDFLEVIRELN